VPCWSEDKDEDQKLSSTWFFGQVVCEVGCQKGWSVFALLFLSTMRSGIRTSATSVQGQYDPLKPCWKRTKQLEEQLKPPSNTLFLRCLLELSIVEVLKRFGPSD